MASTVARLRNPIKERKDWSIHPFELRVFHINIRRARWTTNYGKLTSK